MAPPAAPPPIPDYEFDRELGRGGMGTVYLYRNRLLDRLEVVKLLAPEVLERPGNRERFQREIQAAARLGHHPNIVAAYAAVRVGDGLAFCMEYVQGDDLARVVEQVGPLPFGEAAAYAHQAACGLDHAHEMGMVHRDIKPGNLMRSLAGRRPVVKILDFGLAKAAGRRELEGGSELTRYGQVLGTPDFIAPEQIRNTAAADIRADLYSLGCSLYYLLAGRPPFKGESLFDLFQLHLTEDPPPLEAVRAGLPAGLAAVVARLMAKEPADRFQTPAEVAEALAPFADPGAGSQPVLTGLDDPRTRPTTPFGMEAEGDAADPSDTDEAARTPSGALVLERVADEPPPGAQGVWRGEKAAVSGRSGRPLLYGLAGTALLAAAAAGWVWWPQPVPVPPTPPTPPVTTPPTAKSGDGERKSPVEGQKTGKQQVTESGPAPRPVDAGELIGPARRQPPPALWQTGPDPAVAPEGVRLADGQAVLFDGPPLGDFDLTAEVVAAGGVGLLVRGERRAADGTPAGHLVGLGRADDPGFVAGAVTRWGSRSGVRKPLATGDPAQAKPGQPVAVTVQARGQTLRVRVGGVESQVTDATGYPAGRLGLVTLPGGSLEVRRLAVKPVAPPAPPTPPTDAPEFTPLVAPDSLAGWVVEGKDRDWEATDRVLSARQLERDPNARGSLLTADDLGDFVLRFEYWLEPEAALYVCLRGVPGETREAGGVQQPYHPWLSLRSAVNRHSQVTPTGNLQNVLRGGAGRNPPTNALAAPPPDRTWHRVQVTMKGGHIRVELAGRLLTEHTLIPGDGPPDPPGVPAGLRRAGGRIGFTPVAGEVRVREVRVKRL